MKRLLIFLAPIFVLASPAQAKILYSTYDGPDPVVTGKGGAKITEQGIDWWTGGDPPRPYRIVGILTDTRGNGRFSGDALGSKNIAKKVKAVGGNAVVVYKSSDAVVGSSTYAQRGQGYAAGMTNAITSVDIRRSTSFIVIQVLQ